MLSAHPGRFSGVADHFRKVVALGKRRTTDQSGLEPSPPAEPAILLSYVTPVFNTSVSFLKDLLSSFQAQNFPGLELVLSDDGSTDPRTLAWLSDVAIEPGVVVVRDGVNRGIAAATNRGIQASGGRWITFLDHDDAIAPGGASAILAAIQANPEASFIYTDEVLSDTRLVPKSYFLKPAFDDVLLSGMNYVNHSSVYRRDRLLGIGGLSIGLDGSQDYDLVLRYTAGLADRQIVHVPYPCYVWRRGPATFSVTHIETALQHARQALLAAYRSVGASSVVASDRNRELHRVVFASSAGQPPLVSIVIPSRDAFRDISRILQHLFTRTEYPNLEVIVVDNGSTDPDVAGLYDRYEKEFGLKTVRFQAPFNFSESVNRGIATSRGDLVLLLNNDVEVIHPDWLTEMVACVSYPDVGVVGARLLYPSGRIQHAGVIVGFGGAAGHWYCGRRGTERGIMARLTVRQRMTAVTGAAMLVSRRCLDAVGPFDVDRFPIAYNDVDFCLRAGAAGFKVIWTPFSTLVHHESASRGSDSHGRNHKRFLRDLATLRAVHKTDGFLDPSYSPWLSTSHAVPRLILPDRLPGPRYRS